MRAGAGALAIAAAAALSQGAIAGPDGFAEVAEIDLPGKVVRIVSLTGAVLIHTDIGETFVLHGHSLDEAGADIDAEAAERDRVYPAMLPHSIPAHGNGNIRAAWLSDATDRYRHGVLGDRLEAATLRVRHRDGAEFVLAAGADAVFEDLEPRLVDLDGDGRDEIVMVKSYLDHGAALAVAGLGADGLGILDETPPIGRPNRWLNPVGAADFDGDGRVEIAYVETPHIGGTLMIWEWRHGDLVREHAEFGFSNHAMGSTELRLSAIADVDGDGLMDLAVPSRHRDRLRVVSLAGGAFRELADIALGGAVVTAIAPIGDSFVLGLEDGRLLAVRPHRP